MPLPSQRKGSTPSSYGGSLVSGRNLSKYVGSSVGILARVKQHEEGHLLLMEAADGTEIRCRMREGDIPTQKWLHIVGEVQPQLEIHQHAENPLHVTIPHEQPLETNTLH